MSEKETPRTSMYQFDVGTRDKPRLVVDAHIVSALDRAHQIARVELGAWRQEFAPGKPAEVRAKMNLMEAELSQLEAFKPSPAQVNALPRGIREYIVDLETRVDPAGTVSELTLLRDQNAHMQRLLALWSEDRNKKGVSDGRV